MEYCHSRGSIDGHRRKRRPGIGGAYKTVECFCLVVCLYPGAHSQRLAVCDVAFKNRFVGHQYLSAAIGQNAAHFGEGEKRIQWNCDASGADDRQKPIKTSPVISAINADELAWTQCDRTTEKGVHGAYVGMQISETIMTVLANCDFAISFASNQLVQEIGHRDFAVTRELKLLENVHWAATGLRPQSLATQYWKRRSR